MRKLLLRGDYNDRIYYWTDVSKTAFDKVVLGDCRIERAKISSQNEWN